MKLLYICIMVAGCFITTSFSVTQDASDAPLKHKGLLSFSNKIATVEEPPPYSWLKYKPVSTRESLTFLTPFRLKILLEHICRFKTFSNFKKAKIHPSRLLPTKEKSGPSELYEEKIEALNLAIAAQKETQYAFLKPEKNLTAETPPVDPATQFSFAFWQLTESAEV